MYFICGWAEGRECHIYGWAEGVVKYLSHRWVGRWGEYYIYVWAGVVEYDIYGEPRVW